MKNQTKLWFLIIVSAFCSLFIFIAFGFVFGDIWDKGYDLNKLNALSDQTLTAIEQPITVSKETIQPIVDDVHMAHPAIRFEWIVMQLGKKYTKLRRKQTLFSNGQLLMKRI